METQYSKLWKRLSSIDRFLLSTHVDPDPDGWGSEIGLSYLLQSVHKDVIAFNHDRYEEESLCSIYDGFTVYSNKQEFDRSILEDRVVVSLDNSDISRIGAASQYIKKDLSNLIVIDHHDGISSDDKTFFLFPNASATSEIIYILCELAKVEIPIEVAQALYLGLVVDTGHFRYSKTSHETHRVAAGLLAAKVNPAEISENLVARFSFSRFKARQLVYNQLKISDDSNIAWFAIKKEHLEKENISSIDLSGIINEFLEVQAINIAIFFIQKEPQFTRVTFRAKHGVNLLSLVKKYGGGGHKTACGVGLQMSLDKAVPLILSLAKTYIK